MEISTATILAFKEDTRRAGVPKSRMAAIPEGLEPVIVSVDNVWISGQLTDDWTVAYRVVPQEGWPVVAEIRIYPAQAAASGHEPGERPGRWNGEFLGVQSCVPQGGLTARMLRKELHLGPDLIAAKDVMKWIASAEYREKFIREVDRDPGPGMFAPSRGVLAQIGFRHPGHRPRKAGKPGRPPTPAILLAYYAREYVQALPTGRPLAEVASRHRMSVSRVRDLVHRARLQGLLWPLQLKPGRPAGRLTPIAESLLPVQEQSPAESRPLRGLPSAERKKRRRARKKAQD